MRAKLFLLILVGVLGLGLWAYKSVERSLRAMRETGLSTLLDTQVEALERWIGQQRQAAERLAAHPALPALLERPGDPAAARLLAAVPEDERPAALRLVDRSGSARQALPGDLPPELAPPAQALDAVFGGYTRLIPSAAATRRLLWIAAPVRGVDGAVRGALLLGFPAEQEFHRILSLSRPGETGEAFAFGPRGRLLAPSRFGPVSEPLTVPGEIEEAVLERLVATALDARGTRAKGVLLEPYASYTGKEVIGAWRWLPEHDMGIAVEMAAAEAYAALAPLQMALAGVVALLGIAWFALFVDLRGRGRPRQVGPYRIVRQIGEGAISNVYLARHALLERPAALKVLKAQATTDEWTARFEREVQAASGLTHPNTIAIYDYGRDGPTFYYAMEYLEGLALSDLVERYGPLPPGRAAYLLRQVCASLAEAHARGLVHRDIKPQNIMTCRLHGAQDVVKVLDFGLVKRIDAEHSRDLTRALRILGTPLYMSPERIRDPGAVDARADIYSLGAVAFWLLTGRKLFETASEHDLTYHVLHVPPRRVAEFAPVPPAFEDLVARCLAKDPARRPSRIEELAEALDAILAEAPWTERQVEAWWREHWVGEEHPERRR